MPQLVTIDIWPYNLLFLLLRKIDGDFFSRVNADSVVTIDGMSVEEEGKTTSNRLASCDVYSWRFMLGGQVVTHLIMKLAFDDLSFLIFFFPPENHILGG